MQHPTIQTTLGPLMPGYAVPPVLRPITLIIIHCTASRCTSTLTPEALDKLHRSRGFSYCGYHFYITHNGTIHPMRPLNQIRSPRLRPQRQQHRNSLRRRPKRTRNPSRHPHPRTTQRAMRSAYGHSHRLPLRPDPRTPRSLTRSQS